MKSEIELRHLRYFVAVAELRSFCRAAAALNISQPPLSRQIRDLERCVGAALLHRTAQGVSITSAGQAFLEESRAILDHIPRAVTRAHSAARGEAGSVRLGYPPLFDSAVLSAFRDCMARRCPQLQLQFHSASSEEQARMLREESLDAGFLMLPVGGNDGLAIEPLIREPAVAVLSSSYALARRRQIALADLGRMPILQVRDEFVPSQENQAARIGVMSGVRLNTGHYVRSFDELLTAVRQFKGAALVPLSVRAACRDGIKCVGIRDRSADFTFGIAYRRDGITRPLTKVLAIARLLNQLRRREESRPVALSGS